MSFSNTAVLQENAVLNVLQQQLFEPITRALQEKAKTGTLPNETFSAVLNSMTNDILGQINRFSTSPQLSDTERETPEKVTSLQSEDSTSPSEVNANTVAAALNDSEIKEMHPRRKTKRSLEFMVQKLTGEKQLEAETGVKTTPPPPPPPPPTKEANNMVFPPNMLPQMARFMMPQMVPSLYLNTLLHTPLTNYLSNLGLHQFPTANIKKETVAEEGRQTPEEDIKIDVDSDDLEASPSPSSGNGDNSFDAIENVKEPISDIGSNENEPEKPFKCEHSNCYKRFANKFLLKKHRFIHTGLRPHECPFCNKRFNRKDNLLRHKKTHTQNGATPTVVNPAFQIVHSKKLKKPNGDSSPTPLDFLQIDTFRFQLELARMTNPPIFEKNEAVIA